MERIRVLPKDVAQLIAAGEVVERPASVVKELVENSIDAGATAVRVDILGGGQQEIRVSDNGIGMSEADAETCFLRHATSKISAAADIGNVLTLGFRGEALASIAAVSKVELITRPKEEEAGVKVALLGGAVIGKEPIGAPVGTVITVRDLFFNTPARKKFLKSERAETGAVGALMDRLALSHPEISFRYTANGKQELFTPGDGQLKSAVLALFGSAQTGQMIPVKGENAIAVSGFISKPLAARGNRNQQYFFINGRSVTSGLLSKALEAAYAGSIMVGKFPVCVLNIDLDASAVDVNVHPSKSIVKFSDEKAVFGAVYGAALTALGAVDQLHTAAPKLDKVGQENIIAGFYDKPAVQPVMPLREKNPAVPVMPIRKPEPPRPSVNVIVPYSEEAEQKVHEHISYETVADHPQGITVELHDRTAPLTPAGYTPPVPGFSVEKEQPEPEVLPPSVLYIGEIFDTYLIAQVGDEVCFVDKHAAHERLIFEKLNSQPREAISQALLISQSVSLDRRDKATVLEHLAEFTACGFDIEDYGGNSLLVRAIPVDLEKEGVADALEQAVSAINDKREISDNRTKILRVMACKAAIKGGRKSSDEEKLHLLEQLLGMPDVKYCPHGRPIVYTMTKNDFEKIFKRIV